MENRQTFTEIDRVLGGPILFVRPSLTPRSFLSRTPLFRARTHTHVRIHPHAPVLQGSILLSFARSLSDSTSGPMFSTWCIACGQERSERGRERKSATHSRSRVRLLPVHTNVCLFARQKRRPFALGVVSCENRALKGRKGIFVEWTNEKRASERSYGSAMARGVGSARGAPEEGMGTLSGGGVHGAVAIASPRDRDASVSSRVSWGEDLSRVRSRFLRFLRNRVSRSSEIPRYQWTRDRARPSVRANRTVNSRTEGEMRYAR